VLEEGGPTFGPLGRSRPLALGSLSAAGCCSLWGMLGCSQPSHTVEAACHEQPCMALSRLCSRNLKQGTGYSVQKNVHACACEEKEGCLRDIVFSLRRSQK
jgi:hypothetical protein